MGAPRGSIIVAGGGIGGISAAMGLANKGYEVVVLEQAPQFGEIGAGIQIGPNAFHAMDYLGVGDAGRAKAVYVDKLIMMDGLTGNEVAHIDVGEGFRRRFGNPYAVIHRADLHEVFLAACQSHPMVTLVNNQTVVGYVNTSRGAKVLTASGETFEGDAVIGADGIRSRIRAQLTGGDELKLSGHVAYRAVLSIEQMPEDLRWNAATLWAGPKCHMVHYPLQGWKTFNLVATFVTDYRMSEPTSQEPVRKSSNGSDTSFLKPVSSCKYQTAGADGCLAIEIRSKTGLMVGSSCWATPRTRPTSTWRRGHAWRWKTPACSLINSKSTTVTLRSPLRSIRRRVSCVRTVLSSPRG